MRSIECLWEKGSEFKVADSWDSEDVERDLNDYLTNTFQIDEVVEDWIFKGFIIDGEFWTGCLEDYEESEFIDVVEEDIKNDYRQRWEDLQ